MQENHLIDMVKQIDRNLNYEQDLHQRQQMITDHLQKFWAPRMRVQVQALEGTEIFAALDDYVQSAILSLRP